MTVSGTGFAGHLPRGCTWARAGRVTANADWYSNAGYYQGVQWVMGSSIVSGAWSKTLTLDAEFSSNGTAVDCRVTACAVFTFAAHGSADRGQDTVTPMTFLGDTTSTTSTHLHHQHLHLDDHLDRPRWRDHHHYLDGARRADDDHDDRPRQPDPDGEITGGHLDWGVKASFRCYVTGPVAAAR